MKSFAIGKTVTIKCRMMFDSQNYVLFLTAEEIELIGEVKVVVI